jgi:hypothetical protein
LKDDQLQRLSPTEASNHQRQLLLNNVPLWTTKRTQMPDTIKPGTILIKEGTLLPEVLRFESETFLPGWRVVKDLDGYGLGQKIEEVKWCFFYLAGEIRAITLGREELGTLRRAVKQILAKPERQKFNSMEITKVALKRFLGILFLSVTAHFRHIQQGICLVQAEDFVLRMPESGCSSGGIEGHGAVTRKQYAALFSSS